MRLLYHCPLAKGGLALYGQHQAAALAALPGVELLWHAPESLALPDRCKFIGAIPAHERSAGRSRLRRGLDFLVDTMGPYHLLIDQVETHQPDVVVLCSWGEYFAPLWAWQLRRLKKRGVAFAVVAHDPIRDFVRGPRWFHDWSLREACSIVDVAFVHDMQVARSCSCYNGMAMFEIPHGPYPVPFGDATKQQLRRDLAMPEDALVLLSFGHIRDGKNLDQIIAALPSLPSAHLLVAGREQSAGQKPAAYYQELASRLGVEHRCHWHIDYIPNEEVWKHFRASDLLLLTYSSDFRSASGVLNVNAQFGLPVLASAGASPLLDVVKEYQLGSILQNPNATSIAQAVPQALDVKGEWQRFAEENSWHINAERVVEALAGNAETRKF